MTREDANKLITRYNDEFRAAVLARRGSKKQRDAMLGLAMRRAELIEALAGEGD